MPYAPLGQNVAWVPVRSRSATMLPMHWLHSPSSKVSATVDEAGSPWEITCGGPGIAGAMGGSGGGGARVVVGAVVAAVLVVSIAAWVAVGTVDPARVEGVLPAQAAVTASSRTITTASAAGAAEGREPG